MKIDRPMGVNPDNIMNPITNMLDVITKRQEVVGHNIANVSTPGYSTQELPFQEVLANQGSPFETKLSKQMTNYTGEFSTHSTGQPVNLSREFLKMQENMLFYNMATRRLTTIITSLKTASQIGR